MSQELLLGTGGSVRQLIQAVGQSRLPTARSGFASAVDIPALNALALRSLGSLFVAKEKLFSRRAMVTDAGVVKEPTCRKRTIIALLGLRRLAEAGGEPPFDLAAARDAVLENTEWVGSVEDLGLLTWFMAEFAPDRLRGVFDEFDFGRALETYVDGRQARTRRLAWFLAGIAHARLSSPERLPDLTDVAVGTYRLLQDNQGEGGLFGSSASPGRLKQAFCRRFGTFSDQIHSIYALTAFARAFQIEEPLVSALSCANSIRALQGELGQWWYLYDTRACRVVNRYPVFSLQQDGTAPVGLLALSDVTGQSFHEAIYKGLSWIAGGNELGDDLRNLELGWIWDSVQLQERRKRCWEAALSFLNVSRKPHTGTLKIRCEARADHFGWLLYAFGSFGLPTSAASAGTGTALG